MDEVTPEERRARDEERARRAAERKAAREVLSLF